MIHRILALFLSLPVAAAAAEFEVTTTADAGAGSLRAAIEAVNAATDPADQYDIVFRLPGPDANIAPATPLPPLTRRFVRLIGQPVIAPGVPPQIHGSVGAATLVFAAAVEDAEVRDLTIHNRSIRDSCVDASALAHNASLLFDSVVFQRCQRYAADGDVSPQRGGALQANGTVSIVNSRFVEAIVSSGEASARVEGGAIAFGQGSLYVEGSHFESVSAYAEHPDGLCGGGAIWVEYGDLVVIDSSFDLTYAECPSGGAGGAIGHAGGNMTLRGVQIQNAGAGIGGGVWYGPALASNGRIENSVFVDNGTYNSGDGEPLNTPGGAVFLRDNPGGVAMVMRNNTFLRNASERGGGAHLGFGQVSWTAFHSNLFGDTGDDVNGLPGDACFVIAGAAFPAEPGNSLATDTSCDGFAGMQVVDAADLRIESVPRVDSPLLAVRVLPGSPAIDAGSARTPSLGDALACMPVDIDGTTRPRDGDADGEARCDIGAHEVLGEHIFGDGFES